MSKREGEYSELDKKLNNIFANVGRIRDTLGSNFRRPFRQRRVELMDRRLQRVSDILNKRNQGRQGGRSLNISYNRPPPAPPIHRTSPPTPITQTPTLKERESKTLKSKSLGYTRRKAKVML